MLTRNRVREWIEDEVTQAYFAGLKEKIRELSRHLVDGGTLEFENADFIATKTANSVGIIQGLKMSLEVDLENALIEEDE